MLENGKQVVNQFEKNSPNWFIMDLMMPEDGRQRGNIADQTANPRRFI